MEFSDEYSHENPQITYITESIKCKEIEEIINYQIDGCQCIDECRIETCKCLQRSGNNYQYDNKNNLNNYKININNHEKPIYECNENCNCLEICGNRLVQFGPNKHLKIINTTTKGLGVITLKQLDKGNFICEYAGEIITEQQAKIRYQLYKKMELMNYIFCVNENFGNQTKFKTFIDPTFYGNIGRYINHSCQPNCTLIPIRIHDIIPRLFIFTRDNIESNTEITFDYGNGNCTLINNNQGVNDRKICECTAINCRGFLPYDSNL